MSTDPDEFFHTSVDVWSTLVGSTFPDRYSRTDEYDIVFVFVIPVIHYTSSYMHWI